MPLEEEKVHRLLQQIADEAKLNRKIRAVVHRTDYGDYLAVLGALHYADIREKLVDDFVRLKNADVKREILYKLTYPNELDEFQKAEMGISDDGADAEEWEKEGRKDGKGAEGVNQQDYRKNIAVDDSDKYDWL